MTAVTRPRGPLPARVYWTRRLLVMAVALGLVFGVARLLGSTGSPGDGPSARPVGAEASTTTGPAGSAVSTPTVTASTPPATPTVTPTVAPTPAAGRVAAGRKAASSASPPPSPSGTCTSSDVVAVPSLEGPAYAGRPVVFAMTLTTKVSPACTWAVSSDSLVMKVTSGTDRVWSTQQCTSAVPERSVVVRKDTAVTVPVTWSGQRSDSDCTRSTPWAEPGYYHAISAAFGAEPTDLQFELVTPPRRTVTATPTPRNEKATEQETAKPSRPKPGSTSR